MGEPIVEEKTFEEQVQSDLEEVKQELKIISLGSNAQIS